MKEFVPCGLQEFVRNLLETSDKGIVSYIPFKFAFQNLTFLALCQKLPTAFFSGIHFSHHGDLVQKFAKIGAKTHQIGAKIRYSVLNVI